MGTVAWTRREGILVPFAEGYRRQLSHQGHPPGSTKHHISLMGQLSWWLADNELEVGDLTRARAEDFLATRRARGQRRVPTLATLSPLLDYLRDCLLYTSRCV